MEITDEMISAGIKALDGLFLTNNEAKKIVVKIYTAMIIAAGATITTHAISPKTVSSNRWTALVKD